VQEVNNEVFHIRDTVQEVNNEVQEVTMV